MTNYTGLPLSVVNAYVIRAGSRRAERPTRDDEGGRSTAVSIARKRAGGYGQSKLLLWKYIQRNSRMDSVRTRMQGRFIPSTKI